jgi:hypothetical protein
VLIEDVKPVGYHAWIDGGRLALFVLGQPATLRLARPGRGEAEIVASDIGRSLQRIPGTRSVSFVQREGEGRFVVKELKADESSLKASITTLTIAVEGSSDRDTAWMPDGTLLMSAGAKLYAWNRGESGWREVYDGTPHRLRNLSRMAVAPAGKAIAIVAAAE